MKNDIIGRKQEIEILNEKYTSRKSEFVALYGRRRVGKTYLVRNLFEDKFTFRLTGLGQADLKLQLANFYDALAEQYPKVKLKEADNWMEAFRQLRNIIEKSKQKRKILFIDELPWFDTPHSGFIPALEHFWNSWASARKDILLIVCGSAASWMISKLINNKGGLHNRVTQKLRLEPFTLKECEALLRKRNNHLDHSSLFNCIWYWAVIRFTGMPSKKDKVPHRTLISYVLITTVYYQESLIIYLNHYSLKPNVTKPLLLLLQKKIRV